MTNRIIRAWLNHSDKQPVRLYFDKYWSDYIYPCQTMTCYGAIFLKDPYLLSNDYKTSFICTIEELL